MRETKFRAYDEGNEQMHYDFEFISSGNEGNAWIIFKSDKQTLEYSKVFDNPYMRKQLKIMQYTGLKDMNDVEIYEGDILYGYDNNGIAEYDEDNGMFVLIVDNVTFNFGDENSKWYEVIGNIYENPELREE